MSVLEFQLNAFCFHLHFSQCPNFFRVDVAQSGDLVDGRVWLQRNRAANEGADREQSWYVTGHQKGLLLSLPPPLSSITAVDHACQADGKQ